MSLGDGVICQDINECLSRPCSPDPLVICQNTEGSFKCGDCPDGYTGDGFTCTKASFCDSNPCNEEAECHEYPIAACQCPDGTVGTGLRDTTCDDREYYGSYPECNDGILVYRSRREYNCSCFAGYFGKHCGYIDECYANPNYCGSAGICRQNETDTYCECDEVGVGPRCESGCNLEVYEDSGSYTISSKRMTENLCSFTVHSRHRSKVIKGWFNETTSDGRYEVLTMDQNKQFKMNLTANVSKIRLYIYLFIYF